MPGWLQIALGVASLVVVAGQIVARWGGRAARQDVDGRAIERTTDAVQRHETTDATLAQSIDSLASIVSKMDAKLDRALVDITAAKVDHAAAVARAESDRDRIAKIEARIEAQDAHITRVDEAQTAARHALRGEIHGWVHSGITDALKILETLATGGYRAPRPRNRG